MVSRLFALSIDANDPARLADFWAAVLGWARDDGDGDELTLLPNDDTGFRIRFLPTSEPKSWKNQMHFDLTSRSLDEQQSTVAKALGLGARHIDVGQLPEEKHVVLADPEGNEFCVIEPGNAFLADCGFIGAIASDGTQQVGYFWSKALGWPLVWDQDEETAIRSPHGGPKITWGGPPIAPKPGKNRLHFDLAPPPGGDQTAEVERLVSLGGTKRIVSLSGTMLGAAEHGVAERGVAEHGFDGHGADGSVLMADPDGNEFCVLTPR